MHFFPSKIIICSGLLLFAQGTNAQVIIGKVFDKETDTTLASAHVYWTSSIGTITNEEGVFSMQYYDEGIDLSVSHVGYLTYKISRDQVVIGDTLVIELTPQTLEDARVATDIRVLLEQVVERTYDKNQITFFDLLHRDLEYVNDTLVHYTENKGFLELSPYSFTMFDSIERQISTDHIFFPNFNASSKPALIKSHFILSRPEFLSAFDNYEYSLEQYSGSQVVISFKGKNKKDYHGYIYFDLTQLLISRLEFTTPGARMSLGNKALIKAFTGLSISFDEVFTVAEVRYENDLVIPVFLKNEAKIDGKRKREEASLTYLSHLVIVRAFPKLMPGQREIISLPLETFLQGKMY